MGHSVAFHRGNGAVADRILRWATRSPFGPCAMILTDRTPRRGDMLPCPSASGRAGGVRVEDIAGAEST
ncbi:hypothetical protein [Jannaschia seohaensis]|uniref:Uncharacterized protein n=1 Tax=Jannaschia seohaensis TaxID=475081 RepID=A0A2Y9B378_9RHOB|nr:hypothetical protein [Jannaschia seohaensis]PWJ12455.1 hypothetical protein BCF38_11613 [Jannaschia seohaensis]SSA50936.1 hypothetical protein SAMN05421539_11613 [Jannaschia seohaensis]